MQSHVEYFNKAAGRYDHAGELQDFVARRLAEKIYRPYIKPGLTVLEIGCGTGLLTRHLPDIFGNAAKFIITDAAPDMVDRCRAGFSQISDNAHFETMHAEDIPLRPNSVDHIVTSMTAQWFADPVQTLANMRALLKRDGLITYTAVGRDNFTEWREHLKHRGLDFGMRELPETYPGAWREEFIPRAYGNGKNFLKMLKDTGAGAPKPDYQKPSPRAFAKAIDEFDGNVTWHIVYGRLPALAV